MKTEGLTPVEALESMIGMTTIMDRWSPRWADRRRERGDEHWPPGAMVEAMPEYMRESLKQLRSEDIAAVQRGWIYDDYRTDFYKSHIRSLTLEFDRKVLKIRPRQYREKKY